MKKVIPILVSSAIITAPLLADTTFVSGSVSGVWDTSGSPYVIIDTVVVDSAETLVIMPDVEIILEADIKVQTSDRNYGFILAIGDVENPINFAGNGNTITDLPWNELRILFGEFRYCYFDSINFYLGADVYNCVFQNSDFSDYPGYAELWDGFLVMDCIFKNTPISGALTMFNSLIYGDTISIYAGVATASNGGILLNYCTLIGKGTVEGSYAGMMTMSIASVVNSVIIEDSVIEFGDYSSESNCIHRTYGEILYEPFFIDPIAEDFHLSDSSAAIGAGDTFRVPDHDLDGNPRPNPLGSMPDLGCYENPRAYPAAISETEKPAQFAIRAYPNPFNSAVNIRISGIGYRVSDLEIFDIKGRMVANIPVEAQRAAPAGRARSARTNETVVWTPDKPLGSGIYLVRVKESNATTRIIYIK
ncbi:hypothetical protein DRQ36_09115 [bacterium]|nr:MAG: hypothetical protein DRQ36_09115 [bacterium]